MDGTHVVSGTEGYDTVTIATSGRLEVPSGTTLTASTVVLQGSAELDVSGGHLHLTNPEHSGSVSVSGRCAHFNLTQGAEVALLGSNGYANTNQDGPYDGFISTSRGGGAVLDIVVESGLLMENATLEVRGGNGFDLPASTHLASSAWKAAGTLSGDVAAGGLATVSIVLSSGAVMSVQGSNLTVQAGVGGKAADGGPASGTTPGKGGGYCNGGTATGWVGSGGTANLSVAHSGTMKISSSRLVVLGGPGGTAGNGGKPTGIRGGGGGGGYAGGDGAGYDASGGYGTVSGHVGAGGNATLTLDATEMVLDSCHLMALAGSGGNAGDGADGLNEGGGGGGGYGGGGGNGRGISSNGNDRPGDGRVWGDVGTGGSSDLQVTGSMVAILGTIVNSSAGSGGDAGDGGDGDWGGGYDGGGAGGGGYGGGGGAGDNCLGGDTWVSDRVGSGGPSTIVLNGTSRLNLWGCTVLANGGRGGVTGTGGLGPYGGGGGGGYGGAGGGGGGAYEGGSCTLTGSIASGGDATLELQGIPCVSPDSDIGAFKGAKGDGSASPGGGASGGEGAGFAAQPGISRHSIPMCVPYLITPENGSNSAPSMFRYWAMASTSHSHVTSYRIQIANDTDFSNLVVNATTTLGQYAIPTLEEGVYYWRVMAYYRTSPPLSVGWSDVYHFQFGDNVPPVRLGTLEDLTMAEDTVDDSVDLAPIFFDEDGDDLSFNATTGENLEVTITSSGRVTIAPSTNWTGSEIVIFNCSDGFRHVAPDPTVSLKVTVTNVNDAPVVTIIASKVTMEDEDYLQSLNAYDSDPTGDTMTWSLETAAAFLSLRSDPPAVTGMPDNSDVGEHLVKITVSDDHGASSSLTYILVVLNVNDDPTIVGEDVTSCLEGLEYSVDYGAVDGDPTGDRMTWDLVTDASFLGIDAASGLLHGTPDDGDVGNHHVRVIVSDGKGGFDAREFVLTVTGVNDPPRTAAIGTVYFVEGTEKRVDLSIFISDVDSPRGNLSLTCDAPGVLGVDGLSITFLFEREWEGARSIYFNVSDGLATSEAWFMAEIRGVNDPPVVLGIGDLEIPYHLVIDEGATASLEVLVYDEEGDVLTYHFTSTLDGLSITEEGLLVINPPWGSVGRHVVTIGVRDAEWGRGTAELTVDVLNVNEPPERLMIDLPAPGRYKEGENITFEVTVWDPDVQWGQVLHLTWSSDIMGELWSGTSDGPLSFSTRSLTVGRHVLTVTLSDGEFEGSATVEIEVYETRHVSSIGPWVVLVIVALVCLAILAYMVRRDRVRIFQG